MEVHVAAAAMIRREMEDDLGVARRSLRGTGLEEIRDDELDPAVADERLDVLAPTGAQVVDDADASAAGDERLDEMRSDERRAARHERPHAMPDHSSISFPAEDLGIAIDNASVLRRAVRTLEPALIRAYRSITDAPPPNLAGDRDVEYAWITSHMPAGPGHALDFGSGTSYLALAATLRGFNTVALDLAPTWWYYAHPDLRSVRGHLGAADLAGIAFDLVISCSSVEHVGLGRYGDELDHDGDLSTMRDLRDRLHPGGVMLLTIPVGIDAVVRPLHRIYGEARLPRLLDGFVRERSTFWTKDARNRWVIADERAALRARGGATYYALGCFVLRAAT